MAFEMIDSYRLYTCISTDVKKTTGIDMGSILKETDTGFEYIFNGASWVYNPVSVQISDGINNAGIMATNGSQGLITIQPNHISTDNSTSNLLGIGGIFTGVSEDITNYAIMFINVYSDVASATNGLCIQVSHDGIDWHLSECYTIEAGKFKLFAHQCATKYFRINYTNGGVAQTDFHIEIKLCTKNALASSHRIDDSISSQDDASLTKSVLTAQQPDSTFINIGATASGNLKTTNAENSLAIAKGDVTGADSVNKWGNAKDFDSGDGKIDIWDGAEDGEPYEQMTYVFSTTDAIDSISSESVADVYDLTIEGLDINYNKVTQTKTLQGRTRVALDTPLLRVNRAYNNNGTEFLGHVFVYENTTLNLGVPIDTTKIRAIVHPGDQQTEMAIYTIPANVTGYILGGYAATSGARKTTNYVITLESREQNKVFRTKQKFALSDEASSFVPFLYHTPEKVLEKTDIKMTAQMTSDTGGSVSAGFSIILLDN